MILSNLIIVFITLLLSAFFSGMEIAFVSSNKLKIEVDKTKNTVTSSIISYFTDKSSQFISTMLVGNNISLVIYGIYMSIILEPIILKLTDIPFFILLIQTIISTLIILITAEFLPKIAFRLNPNFYLNFFAVPLIIIYFILTPIAWIILKISNLILKYIFKIKHDDNKKNLLGKIDLDYLIQENISDDNKKNEEEKEMEIFRNALDFSDIKIRDCMIPRIEIVAMDINENINTLKQKFIETGLSKILIYNKAIDNIIGYAHSSGLFKNPKKINDILYDIIIVPETVPANKMLARFINENKNVAIIVDEFGGTSGMVTIEDIIEEIFGEIEDEHDISQIVEKKISDNEYVFSARIEIDYLIEKYKINIPRSDEYDTLAGYILFINENFPKVNQEISDNKYTFRILKGSQTKIELVKLLVIS